MYINPFKVFFFIFTTICIPSYVFVHSFDLLILKYFYLILGSLLSLVLRQPNPIKLFISVFSLFIMKIFKCTEKLKEWYTNTYILTT